MTESYHRYERWTPDQEDHLLELVRPYKNCLPHLHTVANQMGRSSKALLFRLFHIATNRLKTNQNSWASVAETIRIPLATLESHVEVQRVADEVTSTKSHPFTDLSIVLAGKIEEVLNAVDAASRKQAAQMQMVLDQVKILIERQGDETSSYGNKLLQDLFPLPSKDRKAADCLADPGSKSQPAESLLIPSSKRRRGSVESIESIESAESASSTERPNAQNSRASHNPPQLHKLRKMYRH